MTRPATSTATARWMWRTCCTWSTTGSGRDTRRLLADQLALLFEIAQVVPQGDVGRHQVVQVRNEAALFQEGLDPLQLPVDGQAALHQRRLGNAAAQPQLHAELPPPGIRIDP